MYIPAHYAHPDTQLLLKLVQDFPLGAVTYQLDGLTAPRVEHMPFDIEEVGGRWVLRAHLARNNPAASELDAKQGVVVFTGPSAYVSPAWYPSKRVHERVVPTWNYAAAHFHGKVRIIDDRDWVHQFLRRLTARHEFGRPDAWSIDDAPEGFMEAMLRAVVGLEVEVSAVEAKWKLSQNKSSEDWLGVVDGLRHEEARQPLATLTAQWMQAIHESAQADSQRR